MTSDLRAQLQSTPGGTFIIERELGGGGMARIFLAHETALGRAVVVKILTPELAAEVSADRFAREVRLAARLQQANIVPLLSAGEANGLPWYSMPYVRGESLRAKLSSGTPMSLADALNILRDVARALAFAHGEGVVHRDIKPENILLSGGAAVVTDFGIAKALTTSRTHERTGPSTVTQTGASIGTPAYMAPEQAAADPNIDHRADVYAWGVVAWELLAGKHPFAGKTTAHAMVTAHLSETPQVVTTIRSDVPPALATLVARCLEKDPAKRPNSANELLATLDQITSSGARASASLANYRTMRGLAIGGAAVVGLAAIVWVVTHRSTVVAKGTDSINSLAVLPFVSVGGDTANEYFAEGIADELTTELAKVPGLRLAPSSSAWTYRHKAVDVREVGRTLGVGAVLQATVRREGAQMRLNAQLSNTDNRVLWSNVYRSEVKDVFAVQDSVVRAIVDSLRVTLIGGKQVAVAKPLADTTDFETYDIYLHGNNLLKRRGDGVGKSIDIFRKALARDPSYVRAWSKLAEAYCVLPLYSLAPVDSILPLGRSAIESAHRLDPSDADALAADGLCDMLAWKPREAAAKYAQALSLDASNPLANRVYASPLMALGLTDSAVKQAVRAVRIDALNATTAWVGAQVMLAAGRRGQALEYARRSIELDTSSANAGRLMYALVLYASGNVDSARAQLERAEPAPHTDPYVGYLTAATGDRAGAMSFIRRLESERGRNLLVNLAQAWTYLGLRDTTRALDALELAMHRREPVAFTVPFSMPAYDQLRHSARFAAVIRGYDLDPVTFGVIAGGSAR